MNYWRIEIIDVEKPYVRITGINEEDYNWLKENKDKIDIAGACNIDELIKEFKRIKKNKLKYYKNLVDRFMKKVQLIEQLDCGGVI